MIICGKSQPAINIKVAFKVKCYVFAERGDKLCRARKRFGGRKVREGSDRRD